MGSSARQKSVAFSTAASLEAAARGDVSAQERLIERFNPFLKGEVKRFLSPDRFRADGEDLLQTVRLAVLKALPTLRARDNRSLASWLRKLTRSRCLDWEKARRSLRQSPEPPRRIVRVATDAREVPARSPTPSRLLMGREEVERLSRAIEAAPPRYRDLLRFLAEKDPEPAEVGSFLGKEPEAARKFTARALNYLRAALGGQKETRE